MFRVVSLGIICSEEYSGMDDRLVASVGMEVISDGGLDLYNMKRIPAMLMRAITKEWMNKECFISKGGAEKISLAEYLLSLYTIK